MNDYARPNRPLGLTGSPPQFVAPPPVGTTADGVAGLVRQYDGSCGAVTGERGVAGVGGVDGLTEIGWQAVHTVVQPASQSSSWVPTEEGTKAAGALRKEPDRAAAWRRRRLSGMGEYEKSYRRAGGRPHVLGRKRR